MIPLDVLNNPSILFAPDPQMAPEAYPKLLAGIDALKLVLDSAKAYSELEGDREAQQKVDAFPITTQIQHLTATMEGSPGEPEAYLIIDGMTMMLFEMYMTMFRAVNAAHIALDPSTPCEADCVLNDPIEFLMFIRDDLVRRKGVGSN